MPVNPFSTAQLAIFRTKPIGPDGYFVKGWTDFIASIIQDQTTVPRGYTLTHAQRLSLNTANVTIASLVFETDTTHVYTWSGKAWIQLV